MSGCQQEALNFTEIKQRQRAVWSSGDYSKIGITLQIVGEQLCEAIDMRAGCKVLDVAAGNGNATLAAARRFAHVTSTDYVGTLLEQSAKRAAAEGLSVTYQDADAEALPFSDGAFDVVLSTFGVMFAPNQDKAAAELTRVTRKGGRIGLANWTPDGFIGQLLKIVGRYAPPPAGIKPPALWGTQSRLTELFAGQDVQASERNFVFRYESPEHWLNTFRSYYGPTNRAFALLDGEKAAALENEVLDLLERLNASGDKTLIIPSEYLEVLVTTT